MRPAERAALDLAYARARMDLHAATHERNRLAIKIACAVIAGRTPHGNDRRMFEQAQWNVLRHEAELEHAAEQCDSAGGRHG